MTVRPILTAPDPRLQAVSTDVEQVTDETRSLIDDMVQAILFRLQAAGKHDAAQNVAPGPAPATSTH